MLGPVSRIQDPPITSVGRVVFGSSPGHGCRLFRSDDLAIRPSVPGQTVMTSGPTSVRMVDVGRSGTGDAAILEPK